MESVNLKLEKGLLNKIDSSLEEYHFSTRTEFIRTAIREKLSEMEKEKIILGINKLKGSSKHKATPDEYERIREEIARKYAKKYGASLD